MSIWGTQPWWGSSTAPPPSKSKTWWRAKPFYREKLGFNPGKFYGEPPTFCIVWRDKVTIVLDKVRTSHPIPLNQYWALYIYVDDVDTIYAEV
jgi:hypothetical protein